MPGHRDDPGGGGGGLPGGGGNRMPKDERPFCQRHRTLCEVGRGIWNFLPGTTQRRRTGCWTVKDEAVQDFRAGKVAQYKVWETGKAIGRAWGVDYAAVERRLTFAGVADSHLYQFVPLCLEIEQGRHTDDPNGQVAQTLRRVAYEAFEAGIRSGIIVPGQAPAHDRRGGDIAPGARGPGGRSFDPDRPTSGVGVIAALAAAYFASRG